jgi:hypothetical protein
MLRRFCRSRSASIHSEAREASAGAGAPPAACAGTEASGGDGAGGGGGVGEGGGIASALATSGAGGGNGAGARGGGFRPICSTTWRISSALTFRPGGVDTGLGCGTRRRIAGGAARGIGAAGSRGCARRTGVLGCTGGGASSDSGDWLSLDSCSLLQPLARLTITAMISQISILLSANFTMLTGRPGFAHVLS